MRIIAFTKYGRLGASSRLRTYQYLPYLRSRNIEVQIQPLFDSAYLEAMYSGGKPRFRAAAALLRRLASHRKSRFDAVWIEKELLPWIPWAIESWLWRWGVPVIVDYDDALFHQYDRHPSMAVRRLLGRKIDHVMAAADVVIAGSSYLGDRASTAGARRIAIVPTVVDSERYAPALHETGRLTIGWIGTPSTARYLHIIGNVVQCAAQSASFIAIGARSDQLAGTPFEITAWTEETETEQLGKLDIGIMPLPDEPWERGKCGYKLIQYMACGLPVVASPVGANKEIVVHGENGFLASSDDEWRNALTRLAEDPDLRRRMGAAGRVRVEQHYSIKAQAPRLEQLLRSLCNEHAPKPPRR